MASKLIVPALLAAALLAGCMQPAAPATPTAPPDRPTLTVEAATATGEPATPTSEPTAPPAPTDPPAPTATEPPGADATATAAPGNGEEWVWRVSSPEELGMDGAALAQMITDLPEKAPYLHSALVVRNGAIAREEYFYGHGTDSQQIQYSITKSIVSILIGIAIEQGHIESVDQRVVDFFPGRSFANMDARKEAMTLRDVLTMTTGLAWIDGDPYWGEIRAAPDWLDYMMGLPLASDPGERFNYCSGCSHILSAILHETTGMTPEEYARENLFGPLGIQEIEWEQDNQGISVGGWGLTMSARDMARIGLLYLNEGNWLGRQIVPAEWVEESTRPLVEADDNLRYGYQWWYHPALEGYAAIGVEGQMIFVRPASDLVVVFTASMTSDEEEFGLIEEYILPALGEGG